MRPPSVRLRLGKRSALLGILVALGLPAMGCNLFRPAMPEAIPLTIHVASDGPLEAGAAVVDISPDENLYLAGYGPMRTSTAVHDPIWARAIVLRRGDLKVALVAVDLIGLQGPDIEEIRELLTGFDPRHVIICATHTHSAPDTLGLWGFPLFGSGKDHHYWRIVRRGVVHAVQRAEAALRPAEVAGTGVTFDPKGIHYNLRRPGMEDDELVVLHVRGAGGGETIATVVELGCHPEVLGRANTEITSDFPHGLRVQLEENLGGTALYVSGAVGGLVTPDVPRNEAWTEGGTFEKAEALGRRLAQMATTAVEGLGDYDAQAPLEIRHSPIYLENENFLYDLVRFTGVIERRMYKGGYIRTEVNRWRVGNLWLASVPGEITPDLALRIKKQAEGTTMILGLANDELGYLIPEADYSLPIYSYERTLCPGPRAGDRVVRRLEDLSLLPAQTIEYFEGDHENLDRKEADE